MFLLSRLEVQKMQCESTKIAKSSYADNTYILLSSRGNIGKGLSLPCYSQFQTDTGFPAILALDDGGTHYWEVQCSLWILCCHVHYGHIT